MTRVFVISNIRLYREGLADMLARDGRLEVVGSGDASDPIEDREGAAAADVVLFDMGVPSALESIRLLSCGGARTKVVALGVSRDSKRVVECAEAGVANQVSRDSSLEELVRAVENAVGGRFDCSPDVAAALARRVARLARRRPADDDVYLTPRQLEVARLLDRGYTNQEIATKLHIELSTAKIHVHNILDKLGVHHRGRAVARLHQAGVLRRPRAT